MMALRISILMLSIGIAYGQSDDTGKMIFETMCSPCHGIHQEKIGPMLASITKKRDRKWLVKFIRNSQAVIVSGDEYANFLYTNFNHQVMPAFTKLSESEIGDILDYIEKGSTVSQNEIRMDLDVIQNDDVLVLRGREIFLNQCASCHSIHHEGSYGPALGSVTKRRPGEWLIAFIRNSQKIIKSGDEYANHIFNSYEGKEMVNMEFLSEAQIKQVLAYIEFASSSNSVQRNDYRVSGQEQETFDTTHTGAINEEEVLFFKLSAIVVISFASCAIGYLALRLFRYLDVN